MLLDSVVSSTYDSRDFYLKTHSSAPETYVCPIKVTVKNQKDKPTCVAHTIASICEYHYKKITNSSKQFSTEFIYGYRAIGYYIGNGMRVRDALKTLFNFGNCFKKDCPGNSDYQEAMSNISTNIDKYKELAAPNKLFSYFRCKTDLDIKTALLNHGPVVFVMDVYENATLQDDVYTYDSKSKHSKHCVMIYGYNNQGWLVQNSWGSVWGGDGRFILPYSVKLEEAWGVTTNFDRSDIQQPFSSRMLDFLYKAFNKIVNWFLTCKRKVD